ncbi:glucose-induced degradation protein 8-like protein isoform X2 [Gossypium australe]|uniref:Glucose-induced degradation protein 8-like protein isoform X2 n=1 Tax=Gossypium australe TaxID=47621 RepID=A0A5B6WWP2_9ROSI|nr:glucose-induced degradation protein 8-like protein isoform X2 [Gossypium australe]
MEHDLKDFRVLKNNRSEEVRESNANSVDRRIGDESRVFDANDRVEQNDMINDDENDRIENSEKLEKDTGSYYKSLLSEFDDYIANDRIGGSYGLGKAFVFPSVRRTRREGHVLAALFGDSSYGWFDPAELVPFDRHFMEKSQQTNSRNYQFALEGNALKAIELIGQLATNLLEKSKDLHFDFLSLHFVELVCSRKCTEALEFAQMKLTPFGKEQKYVEKLEDFMALLAYKEPEKSPMFHLLSLEYRQHVANRAILVHGNHIQPTRKWKG